MPRPLLKGHTIKVRVTEEEHAGLVRLAAGQPLGPAMVAAALGHAPPPTGRPEPTTPEAALAAWEVRWMPVVRRSAPMPAAVVAALAALRKALG